MNVKTIRKPGSIWYISGYTKVKMIEDGEGYSTVEVLKVGVGSKFTKGETIQMFNKTLYPRPKEQKYA
jgi:hypothetical protein